MSKLSLLALFIFSLLPQLAMATCDADILRAMRTITTYSSDMTASQVLYEHSCNRTHDDDSDGLEVEYYDFALGGSSNRLSTAEACATSNREFFSRNKKQIALSFLPEQALAACTCGTTFSVKSDYGNVITVKAADDRNLELDQIILPSQEDAICSQPWTRGTEMLSQGISFTCRRLTRKELVFELKTQYGDHIRVLPPQPKMTQGIIDWRYVNNHTDGGRTHQCYFELNGQEFVTDKNWISKLDLGLNTERDIIRNCAQRHSRIWIKLDGNLVKPKIR